MGKKRTANVLTKNIPRAQNIFVAPSFKYNPKRIYLHLKSFFEFLGKPFYWSIIGSIVFINFLPKITIFGARKTYRITVYQYRRLPKQIEHLRKIVIVLLKAILKILLFIKNVLLVIKRFILPVSAFTLMVLGVYLVYIFLADMPDPNRLITRDLIVSTKIYDRNGQLLYKIYRKQNRTMISLNDLPLNLIQATVAIEDAEFYQHHGLSFKGIIRAALANIREGRAQGGSTITQQLVKNTLLTPEKTIQRKIKELFLALAVERMFTKEEILQMYLNEVGFGGAAYGIEEASEMYFGIPAKDLSLAQAALLAGLPASPTRYSPFGTQPEIAKERQKTVLRRMEQEGFITAEEGQKAVEEKIFFSPQKDTIKAPHFVMYVKEQLVEKYGERMVEEGGLEVTTSLDLKIQTEAEKIVKEEVNKLRGLRISNGAALVTNPNTGEILAMVGSKDYFDQNIDGNVNVTIRDRQPGSTIKAVTYATALQNGYTSSTVIADTPISYNIPGQPAYTPKNYDSRFHGEVPLRIALGSSYNVPAVKVLASVGLNKVIEMGRQMGITTWDDPSRFGLSLTLGGGEVRMTDLAVVYGTIANLGNKAELNPILTVKNYKGEVLYDQSKEKMASKKVISPVTAFILTDILSDNNARTPAFGPKSWLNIDGHSHVAVKTGTTQNLRDNWTIGYTSNFLTAVWVGNNDNSPMSYVASGITGATPIWNKIMTYLLKDQPDTENSQPANLRKIAICIYTNSLPCDGCPTREEWFEAGKEPTNHCDSEAIKKIRQEKEAKSVPIN